jgi:hypothetical protein
MMTAPFTFLVVTPICFNDVATQQPSRPRFHWDDQKRNSTTNLFRGVAFLSHPQRALSAQILQSLVMHDEKLA